MKTKIFTQFAFLLFLLLTVNASRAQIANQHPNDVGIESNPDVLYVEKFDDEINAILSRYTDVSNGEGMSLVADVPEGSLDAYSLKMTSIAGVNNGGHLYKVFSPGWDSTVYLRYYVKYPATSSGYMHHEAAWIGGYNPPTNWPNPRAGECGLGDSRLSISYEPMHAQNMDTYLYWGEMKSWNSGSSCYGNTMIRESPTAQKLVWDKWMCVEMMVKLNNPDSANNGELRIWQNGVEVGHWGPGFPNGNWLKDSWLLNPNDPPFPGFRWRTDAKLNINYIWIEFYHDDDAAPNSSIQYDHLVMAKKYIGPIAVNTGINDNKPTTALTVYPNPSSGKFTALQTGAYKGRVEIYNALGEKITQYESEPKIEIDLSNQPKGIYLLKIFDGLETQIKKLIVR